jgi:GPH family glycoside/pentoside/hexuronide:cation symporter
MEEKKDKLSLGRTLVYSTASIGLNIIGITVGTWLLYFYAPPPDSGRVQYLTPAVMATLLFIVSVWDAVIDPLIGHWSDNFRSRWGRRRPFLIFAAPVLGIATVLLWTPPADASSAIYILYFLFIAIIYFTSFSLVGIPYDATMPEMAPDSKERVKLSYWKSVFGIIGVLIGSLVAAPLFQSIGPVAMGIVIGAVGLFTIWFCLFGLRESKKPSGEPLSVIEGMRFTLKNKQFLYVFVSTLFVHISYQMLTANLPYFVTLVLKQEEGQVGIFQGVLILFMAATGPLWAHWNKKIAQRKLLNISMIILGIALLVTFFVGTIQFIPLNIQAIICFAVIGFSLGGYLIIIYAMMGNVVDYDEMLTNRRREAIYYGTFSFALGLGIAVGTTILPLLLETFGYTQANPMGVRIAFPLEAIFIFIGLIVFRKYRLGDSPEETREIMRLAEASYD